MRFRRGDIVQSISSGKEYTVISDCADSDELVQMQTMAFVGTSYTWVNVCAPVEAVRGAK